MLRKAEMDREIYNSLQGKMQDRKVPVQGRATLATASMYHVSPISYLHLHSIPLSYSDGTSNYRLSRQKECSSLLEYACLVFLLQKVVASKEARVQAFDTTTPLGKESKHLCRAASAIRLASLTLANRAPPDLP